MKANGFVLVKGGLVLLALLGLTACGGGGGSSNTTTTSSSTPAPTMYLGTPASQPAVIPPATATTQVTFLSMVTGNAHPPASLSLDEVDASGNVIKADVATLRDDGQGADKKKGDRIYTGTLAINSVNAAEKRYRVHTTFNGNALHSHATDFWVSGCPATSRPSDPTLAVYDSNSKSMIFSNEILIRTANGVPPDLSAINNIAGTVKGHVVGCIPNLHQYLLQFTNPTADAAGVYNAINKLKTQPDVAAAFPNGQSLAKAQSPLTSSLLCNGTVNTNCQWYLDRVRAPQAWQLAGGGDPQMAVAMIDFGVDCALNGLPCDPTLYNQDPIDHGTGVAALIASPDNSTGMVGAAYHTHLYPYSFLGSSGSQYKMNELITAALSQTDVRVINISAGTGADFDGETKTAVCKAIASGRLVVAAAGNPTGTDAQSCQLPQVYPAAYNAPGVSCSNGADLQHGLMVVGATDINNNLASWSHNGVNQCSNQLYVNLYAPGKDIVTLSSQSTGGYTTKSGTSYAAPLVSAAAAVLWAAHPGDTPAQIHNTLISSADTLSETSTDPRIKTSDSRLAGKRLLDMYRAVGGKDSIPHPDTTPNAFSFTATTGADLQVDVNSAPITVSGIDSPAPITVVGGYYSINGGGYTDAAGSVHKGDKVTVQLQSAANPATAKVATLTVGGVSGDYSVTTRNPQTTPGDFAFVAQNTVALNTKIASNSQTINGIDPNTPISISNGEYAIDGGTFTSAAGTINTGQSVQVRLTSANDFSTTTKASLTVGTVTRPFAVTTEAADITPAPFSLGTLTNQNPGTVVTSSPIKVSGLNTDAVISVSAGDYSIDNGTFTHAAGVVHNGQTVVVQQTTATDSGASVYAALRIGTVENVFTATTLTFDTAPDAFAFTTQTNVTPGIQVTSNKITVSGINIATPISISGGTYAINGGNYTSAKGTVSNGDTVQLQTTSSASLATATVVTLTIGNVSETFTVNTVGADTTPDAFNLTAQTNAPLNTPINSNTIQVTGINTGAPISITGGTYSINGSAYTSTAGTVQNNDKVIVQLTSATTPGTTHAATLNIGGVTSTFDVTTLPAYTVTATASPAAGGNLVISTNPVLSGQATQVSVTTNPGYTLAGVSGCGTGTLSGTTYTTGAITSNCIVTAAFTLNSYTVSTSAGTGGSISPTSASVNYNNTTQFTVTPNTGYGINTVSGCGGSLSGNIYTTDNITGTCTVSATFKDTAPPVITLSGSNPMTVNQGSTFTDPGATATDNVDISVTVTASGTVNTSTIGTYTITYTAKDSAGNTATATRTINVVDVTPPVITLNGSNPMSVNQGATYTEPGAIATDNVDGTVSVSISGTVNTATVGVYIITYTATDKAGNTATATRTVNVLDVTPPVITLNGSNPMSVNQGATYTEPGATATDNVDSTVSVSISGTVDTATVGTYTMTYTATDTAGNTATATRTVNVLDVTPPVITLNGSNPMSVDQGATYTEPGATASDNVDGTVAVNITGTVDTSTVGAYTISYTATDSSGNTASATRTVNVVAATYTVTTLPSTNGTVSALSQTVDSNVQASITVTPNTGFTANVSGCGGTPITGGTGTFSYVTASVTGNCTITANFVSTYGIFSSLPNAMTTPRLWASGTLLPDGKILIAGGYDGTSFLNTAELYNPVTEKFTALTNTMTSAVDGQAAALLPNGKVLFAGGYNGSVHFNTAESYDPKNQIFTAILNTMTTARTSSTATTLPNGKVLIAGGSDGTTTLNSAELYDPTTQTFTALSATMTSPRAGQTAALLPNGKVLIAGGSDGNSPLNTAEIYDPASQTFIALTATMTTARYALTSTLLPNGKVLLAGGYNSTYLNSAEVYDPNTKTFSALSNTMSTPRNGFISVMLPYGQVLLAGGYTGTTWTNSAEVFNALPASSNTFTALATTMTTYRTSHDSTLLSNGQVLIAGGYDNTLANATNTAELYDPITQLFSSITAGMTSTRNALATSRLPDGTILITGGYYDATTYYQYLDTAETYNPNTQTFSTVNGVMTDAREGHTATLLPNGYVLLLGGYDGITQLNTGELLTPNTTSFTALTSTMTSKRTGQSATLLPDGTVLIAGGYDGTKDLNTAEIYHPDSQTFTALNTTMTSPRSGQSATLLPDGMVLIAGGLDGTNYLNSAELYNPIAQTFMSIASTMTTSRSGCASTLLPNGTVLISGGISSTGYLNNAEIYTP